MVVPRVTHARQWTLNGNNGRALKRSQKALPNPSSEGYVLNMAKSETVGEAPAKEDRRADVGATASKIIANIEKVIIGKRQQVSMALVAYFCEGHILLEDVPGVAKTMLARAVARSVGCTFKRIQCTPDLLPTDVTGVSVFNQKTAEFEFRPGPIFAQTVLADEINRATPRTQAALLEAMAERRVTVDGQTYNLKAPFLVMATQNPIDHEGTFPLPEAQLDRFLIRLSLGYPGLDEESKMLQRLQHGHPIDDLGPVVSAAEVLACQETIREIFVDEKIRRYILAIVLRTREHEDVHLGGSPRASIALFRTGQALAAVSGRNFVLPDDVKRMAVPVLGHRLILRPESRLRKVTPASVVNEIVPDVPVPILASQAEAAVDYFQ
jgi:MoxR-like ATPase